MSSNNKLKAITDEIYIAPDAAYNILKDIRRLLRFNPYYEIKNFREIGTDTYELLLRNEANKFEEKQVLRVTSYDADKKISIEYDSNSGMRIMTTFDIQAADKGIKIAAEDNFDLSKISDKEKISEIIDRTIPYWLSQIRSYLKLLEKKTLLNKIKLFYKEKIWLEMSPFGRRVARLILILTALETLLILGILIGYKLLVKY
ncbi:MAG: hypothetical protein HZA05_04255 [Nitrospirae bacterium]|nr:hypothetical protein [Nitrospirota bacterium]